MDNIEIELLADFLARINNEFEDTVKECYLQPPFDYPQEIVDEVIDIVDRIENLESKLRNDDFKGSYRY